MITTTITMVIVMRTTMRIRMQLHMRRLNPTRGSTRIISSWGSL
jgi:hypothetical protein